MQLHVTAALKELGVLQQTRPGHRFSNRLEALQQAAIVGQPTDDRTFTTTPSNQNISHTH